jgi:hypothetical protein
LLQITNADRSRAVDPGRTASDWSSGLFSRSHAFAVPAGSTTLYMWPDRGESALKGVPGDWRLYALVTEHAIVRR